MYSDIIKNISNLWYNGSNVNNYTRQPKIRIPLFEETNFLILKNISMKTRLWYVYNDINTQVLCPVCSKISKLKFDNKDAIADICSRRCWGKQIDKNTGLSLEEINKSKISKTKSKINIETGLTGYQTGILKTKIIMNQINPITGLSGYQSLSIKTKESNYIIDPVSGLNGYQTGALKTKDIMSKIDPVSGLTGYQTGALKTKDTMSKIDLKTGLTRYQSSENNRNVTMSKIDNTTGLSGYQSAYDQRYNNMNQIDPVTGLSYLDMSYSKRTHTMNQIDPKTKVSGYQASSILRNDTMSKVDNTTKLTGYQISAYKSSISKVTRIYNKRTKQLNIRGYSLISTLSTYLTHKDRLLKYSCNTCGLIRESYWPYIRCTKCYPYNKSIGENEVLEFCQSLTSKTISNSRSVIPPLELDIYIPEYNLAIEYDGIFWHSSYSVETENKDYHLNKTEQCYSKSIQLFHIFENEWQDPQKRLIWKSMIRERLGFSTKISSDDVEVTRITSKDTKEFLDSNHLQGACVSSVNLGLMSDNELLAVMVFRVLKDGNFEMMRYCSKLNTLVTSGASKLLSSFCENYSGSIISHVDRRTVNDNLYENLGFTFLSASPPNYWYWKSEGLESRVKYQKHKLRDKLDVFDEKLTESENMYMNGYRKIYDCGNQVWKFK